MNFFYFYRRVFRLSLINAFETGKNYHFSGYFFNPGMFENSFEKQLQKPQKYAKRHENYLSCFAYFRGFSFTRKSNFYFGLMILILGFDFFACHFFFFSGFPVEQRLND